MPMKKLTVVLALSAFVAACSTAPGNYLDTSSLNEPKSDQPQQKFDVHLITSQLVLQEAQAAAARAPHELPPSRYQPGAPWVYHIEPQDILGVSVFDHPELSTPQGSTFSTGGNTTQTVGQALSQPYTNALPGEADPYGQTVAADGTIYFPFVGRVRAAGKTPGQLRDQLTSGLAPYVKNPQVDVRVLAYRSQKVQVTGDVKTPGPLAISDVPLTLVDAITRSGGATDTADINRVDLTRGGKRYVLNADRLLQKGDTSQNVMLQDGDIVNVPDRTDSRVFVLGEVKNPTQTYMVRGSLTIADALTQAGGILDTDANPRQIFVMRDMKDNPTQPKIFRLDMTKPDSIMLSSQFQLQPLDVVYVGTAASASFNRVLQQVLPTIETVFYVKQITR